MYDIAQLDVRTKRRLGRRLRQLATTSKLFNETLYSSIGKIATTIVEGVMPFRPNYRRDRLDRDRSARSRTNEKQEKRNEKSAKRKAEHTEVEGPPNEEQAQHADGSSAKSEPTN